MRLYDPRADIVFRKIFGTHKNMCISLLNSLLPLSASQKIVSIEYQDPDVLPETPDKKNSVVDVRCTDKQGRMFLVEMQMFWTEAFLTRALFNASKAYVSQSEKGMKYEVLQPVYSLCLLNENMPQTRQFTEEYTHNYYIQHEQHSELRIGGMVFVFVELMKFKNTCTNRVHKRLAELWLTFLTFVDSSDDLVVPEELRRDPDVSSAIECLEQMHLTEAERLAYDKYWDAVSYERTLISGKYAEGVAEGMAKGHAEGLAEGRAEGRAEGLAEGRAEGMAAREREIAADMKRAGLSVEQISAITKLSADEIAGL